MADGLVDHREVGPPDPGLLRPLERFGLTPLLPFGIDVDDQGGDGGELN